MLLETTCFQATSPNGLVQVSAVSFSHERCNTEQTCVRIQTENLKQPVKVSLQFGVEKVGKVIE